MLEGGYGELTDVARAPADLSAKGGQGLDEDSSLDGHVQGAHDLGALERLGGAELGPAVLAPLKFERQK